MLGEEDLWTSVEGCASSLDCLTSNCCKHGIREVRYVRQIEISSLGISKRKQLRICGLDRFLRQALGARAFAGKPPVRRKGCFFGKILWQPITFNHELLCEVSLIADTSDQTIYRTTDSTSS